VRLREWLAVLRVPLYSRELYFIVCKYAEPWIIGFIGNYSVCHIQKEGSLQLQKEEIERCISKVTDALSPGSVLFNALINQLKPSSYRIDLPVH
jgi:hypothetical protein